ncbi:MAG: Gfo/Idh/MocA family oxidoreductase [Thaumarchaeota archaeon]|nr:Gfo/Idh/MocA family oxidoreductase [Nitrososphaerota archaeon]
MVEKVRFGFLGVAHFHSESYGRAIKELPNGEVIAVYEDDEKLGKEYAEKFKIEYYKNPDDLLKRDDIDAVVITAENVKHHDLAVKAAEAGKHILCEKPIAVTVEQADDMVKRAEKAGVKFQTCFVMRYHSTSILVKNLIEDGAIGKVLALVGTNKLNSSLPLLRDWFTQPELSGGGAVMDHTVHLADLIRWYTKSEAIEVYTEIGRNVNPKIKVEDNFLTTIRMENGAIGHIDGSWSYASGLYTWGDVTLEVLGTEGVILLDAFRQNIYYIGMESPNDKLTWHYYGCDPDLEMVKSFIECITQDKEPVATGFDGRQGVAITLASYESVKLGKPVKPK